MTPGASKALLRSQDQGPKAPELGTPAPVASRGREASTGAAQSPLGFWPWATGLAKKLLDTSTREPEAATSASQPQGNRPRTPGSGATPRPGSSATPRDAREQGPKAPELGRPSGRPTPPKQEAQPSKPVGLRLPTVGASHAEQTPKAVSSTATATPSAQGKGTGIGETPSRSGILSWASELGKKILEARQERTAAEGPEKAAAVGEDTSGRRCPRPRPPGAGIGAVVAPRLQDAPPPKVTESAAARATRSPVPPRQATPNRGCPATPGREREVGVTPSTSSRRGLPPSTPSDQRLSPPSTTSREATARSSRGLAVPSSGRPSPSSAADPMSPAAAAVLPSQASKSLCGVALRAAVLATTMATLFFATIEIAGQVSPTPVFYE